MATSNRASQEDLREYLAFLDDTNLSEAQKIELLRTLEAQPAFPKIRDGIGRNQEVTDCLRGRCTRAMSKRRPGASRSARAITSHWSASRRSGYISEGLRRDEAQFDQHTAQRLAEALKRRGVAERILQEALDEVRRAG